MSSISNVPGRPLLVTGIALACFLSGSSRAQTTPTPTPPPAGEAAPPPAPAPKPAAPSGAYLKVSDSVNFRFGALMQPQADWTQDVVTSGYTQNLFIRRVRFLVGGQMAKNLF